MASGMQAAAGAIYGVLNSNITSIDAGWTASTNVAWPGVDFSPPDDFVAPLIVWGDTSLSTMGSNGSNLTTGELVLQFFCRPGSGYGTLNAYADDAIDLYDRASPGSGVEFLAASGPRQVSQDDTRWLQVNVSIPFLLEGTS